MERIKKRRRYKFSGKKQTQEGIISFVTGLISLICLIVSIRLAFKGDGNLGLHAGCIALVAWLLGGIALALGIRVCKNEEAYKFFPGFGLGFGFVATLSWVVIFLIGIIK